MMRAAHAWNKLVRKGQTFGAAPGVGRVFLRCDHCRRIVPYWNLVIAKRRPGQRVGCKCGGGDVHVSRINELVAAYWVLVRGVLIRRVLKRLDNWDPRCPLQLS